MRKRASQRASQPPHTTAAPRVVLAILRDAAAAAVILASGLPGNALAQEDPRIEQLQRQIEELQRQLDELRGEMQEVKKLPPPPPAEVPERPVTSGQDRITLTISGQINRAINVAGDGDRTKVYFVDNDASNSRIRAVGTGQISDDVTVGTQIELAIAPNESAKVSQDNEESGDFFDQRKVEIWADSRTFGRLTLGKGDAATNGTSEVDLSGTAVIMYASVADIAAGLKFRDKDDQLTDVRITDAFSDFDGLSRHDRLRYDSPRFGGFSLSGSVISDQRYDGAVRWGGQGFGLKTAAAAGLADPSRRAVDFRLNGSFSVLHEATGLNLTLSSGMDKSKNGGNPSNVYVKGGWIANFFDWGESRFGIDFTRSNNNPTPSDSGFSVGGAFVQAVPDFGAELYTQLRWYTLDRNNERSVHDIVVGSVGTRVKF